MNSRRRFIKTCLVAGSTTALVPPTVLGAAEDAAYSAKRVSLFDLDHAAFSRVINTHFNVRSGKRHIS